MSLADLHTIASVHRLLAWAAVVAALFAAYLVARRSHPDSAPSTPKPFAASRKLMLFAAALATSLLTMTGATGLLLHEPYQRRLRQRIFVQSPRIGWLFERKEHLAFGAILLALCALAALLALELRVRRRRALPPDEIAWHLRSAAVRAYATSAFLAAIAAAASAIVAHHRSF